MPSTGIGTAETGLTVAVKVTDSPWTERLPEETTVTEVSTGFTDCWNDPLLGPRSLSPLYTAPMTCGPPERGPVLKLAVPSDRSTGSPEFTPSTWNCTTPVGVPAPWPSDTVAVNVTRSPSAEGFAAESSV